jgi:hypothetical protein
LEELRVLLVTFDLDDVETYSLGKRTAFTDNNSLERENKSGKGKKSKHR